MIPTGDEATLVLPGDSVSSLGTPEHPEEDDDGDPRAIAAATPDVEPDYVHHRAPRKLRVLTPDEHAAELEEKRALVAGVDYWKRPQTPSTPTDSRPNTAASSRPASPDKFLEGAAYEARRGEGMKSAGFYDSRARRVDGVVADAPQGPHATLRGDDAGSPPSTPLLGWSGRDLVERRDPALGKVAEEQGSPQDRKLRKTPPKEQGSPASRWRGSIFGAGGRKLKTASPGVYDAARAAPKPSRFSWGRKRRDDDPPPPPPDTPPPDDEPEDFDIYGEAAGRVTVVKPVKLSWRSLSWRSKKKRKREEKELAQRAATPPIAEET